MNRLIEELKPDIGLLGSELANGANATGRYYNLSKFRRALYFVTVYSEDGIADGEEVILTVMQAKTAAGGDAEELIEDIIITGLEDSAVVATDLAATAPIEVDDSIDLLTSDGLAATFTRKAATDATKGEFANAAGLVTCINASGLGLTAVANANVVTISATEAGSKTVTMIENAAQGSAWVPAGITTIASAIVEVYSANLDDGFSHIAINVENDATEDIIAYAGIARGLPYHSPVKQHVAAIG